MISTKIKQILENEVHSNEDVSDVIDYLIHQQLGNVDEADSIKKSIQLMLREEQNLQSIKIEDAARRLYMCDRNLSRKLNLEETTFHQLLDKERMSRCIVLMLKGVTSVDNLTEYVGLTDSSYFYKAFNRWTGISFSQAKAILSENYREFVRLLPSNDNVNL